MKHIVLLFMLLGSLFAEEYSFLSPQEAFNVTMEEKKSSVEFNINLDKTMYLYEEFLKVVIKTKDKQIDITNDLQKHKFQDHDGVMVIYGKVTFDVPFSLIQEKVSDKPFELELQYQGCSLKGLCYSPLTKVYKSEGIKFKKIETPKNLANNVSTASSDEEYSFLTPQEAFNVTVEDKKDSVEFNINLDKTMYLYEEFLKVVIKSPKNIDLTKDLKIKKAQDHDGVMVIYGKVTLDIPKSLIKEKIGDVPYELELQYQGCSLKGLCYSPLTKSYKSKATASTATLPQKIKKIVKPLPLTLLDGKPQHETQNETDVVTNTLKSGSFFTIIIAFFGFGLLLSLTPCIFPMIPILSSIIVQQSNKQNGVMTSRQGFFLSFVYVLSMSIAYTFAGVVAGIFGANLQAILQDPVVIIIFSSIFVALALSMFGYYDIKLPNSLQEKLNKTSDKGSQKGGIIGVAIMGFLSALIVGPCVAPALAGALIYIGQTGDAFLGGVALFVMSIGMGMPLLAIGIGAGKYMPKPGGWMTTVSKIFGIVMLAIALWMLDRIIEPIWFMYLSAFLLIGTALYLQVFNHIMARLITAIVFIYGIVLFIGAISGATNVLEPLENFKGGGTFVNSTTQTNNEELQWTNVTSIAQLEQIVKTTKKPIMLDYWAVWCVSCKELENVTFKDKGVIEELSKYKLLKVDVTENNEAQKTLLKKFNLFGPPALIFYQNGKEERAKRIIGYKNPKDFLAIAKK